MGEAPQEVVSAAAGAEAGEDTRADTIIESIGKSDKRNQGISETVIMLPSQDLKKRINRSAIMRASRCALKYKDEVPTIKLK